MKKFSFNIRFMKSAKCCDFGGELEAENEGMAISEAKQWAKQNGFNGAIKTVSVREIQ